MSTHTIRIWERRYEAVDPKRSTANQRLYSDQDIVRLALLRRGTEVGHAISKLVVRSDDEIRALLRAALRNSAPDEEKSIAEAEPRSETGIYLERCHAAISKLDHTSLIKTFSSAHNRMPLGQLVDEILSPLMRWVGDEWHERRLSVAHEHLASSMLRAFIDTARVNLRIPEMAPTIVVSTPPNQLHEIGAMLAAISAASIGWRDCYFGPNLPPGEIASAAVDINARVVALSVLTEESDQDLMKNLRELVALLPSTTQVIVGGPGTDLIEEELSAVGILRLSTFGAFRTHLDTLNQA